MKFLVRLLGSVLKVLVRGTIGFLLVGVFLAFTQDFQIFPELLNTLLRKGAAGSVPSQVERFLVETQDGENLETWKLDVPGGTKAVGTFIVFHGNAGTVRQFFPYQLWLRDQGYRSYSFDYRGFGLSSGWPSEHGLYSDTDAIIRFVSRREGVDPATLKLLGISVGTGPAAYAAATFGASDLILLAPYTSIADVVKANWFLSLYLPLLRYNFPTIEFIRNLKDGCVILAHGKGDDVVSYTNSETLSGSLSSNVRRSLILDDAASHNDLFARTKSRIAKALTECSGVTNPLSAS